MSQVKPEEKGIVEHAVTLLEIAKAAHARLDDGRPALEPGNADDGYIVILFSAAFLEAFLNELVAMAGGVGGRQGTDHPTLMRFASLLAEAEESHAPVRLRFQLARALLGGGLYEKGAARYDDFSLLFTVRDSVAHPGPATFHYDFGSGKMTKSTDAIDRRLSAKRLVPEYQPDIHPTPGASLTSRAVARWAINSAVDMARSILDCLPPGPFADRVKHWYRKATPIKGASSNDGPWVKKGVTVPEDGDPGDFTVTRSSGSGGQSSSSPRRRPRRSGPTRGRS